MRCTWLSTYARDQEIDRNLYHIQLRFLLLLGQYVRICSSLDWDSCCYLISTFAFVPYSIEIPAATLNEYIDVYSLFDWDSCCCSPGIFTIVGRPIDIPAALYLRILTFVPFGYCGNEAGWCCHGMCACAFGVRFWSVYACIDTLSCPQSRIRGTRTQSPFLSASSHSSKTYLCTDTSLLCKWLHA